jgi:hypothetical protein
MQKSPYRLRHLIPEIGTDQLWPLIVLAGFCFFVSLVPLPPNDFWWHLKIGELIYSTKEIPTTNIFSWAIPADTTFVYGAWLGELLLYLVYAVSRLEGVTFARTILVMCAFWLVVVETHRRSGSWRLGALAVALLAGMALNNLVVRPQMWSWIPFMVYYQLFSRFTGRQISKFWLLACPVVMVFWVNAHGAYILGGVLIGVFFTGEVIRTLLKQPDALTWAENGWILLIGALSALAMLVNPQGIGTLDYVIKLMTDQPSQSLIVEWQTPSPEGIANITFYASILLLLVSLAYSKRKPTPTEILLSMSFLWLAWSGMRYIVWYGMVTLPIIMAQLVQLPIKMQGLNPPRNSLNTILAIVLFIPSILVQPWFVENFPLPERYWNLVQRNSIAGPLVDWDNPIEATEYLRAHPGGKLFNEMGYGSYLIWAVPNQGVFIDPRVELYPFDQWQDYLRITRGAGYNAILNTHGANRIMLHKNLQPELVLALENDPGWVKEYEDRRTQIWKKVGSNFSP